MEQYTVQLLAREAGFVVERSPALPQPWITGLAATDTNIATMLARFAELVAERERAECIRTCENVLVYDPDEPSRTYLEALRSRDATPSCA